MDIDRNDEIIVPNPYGALTEYEILDKLKKSREHAAQGMYKDEAEVWRLQQEK